MSLFKPKPKLKILFVATEAAPFAKAGGLGEVMFSLPRALVKLGYDARVMVPRYAGIDLNQYNLKMELEGLMIPTDAEGESEPRYLTCNVGKYEAGGIPRSPVTTYFLENMEYYEQRANVYGYADDAARWALLCRGVLEFLRSYRNWKPDVIVAADWQTGFLPNYLKTIYKNDPLLASIATVFTIHNLYYQGMFDHRFVSEMDFDDGQSPVGSLFNPRLLKLNGMRRGIMFADVITTVSPGYAKEITTPEYGELLDGLLRERRSRLYGVINAIDYKIFNPELSPNLAKHYSAGNFANRILNKTHLQGRFGLPKDEKVFILAVVARLIEQKGFDLLLPVADQLLNAMNMQLVVLGNGDAKYMSYFQDLEKRFPGRVAANLVFDKELPHLIYAGADAVLVPSKFEPSGLTQMEAMRYGCIPIVRKTGGLADTVEDYDPDKNTGTGFVFENFDSMSLVVAITRAYKNYRSSEIWSGLQRRAMDKDFSWKTSADEYVKVFAIAKSIVKNSEGKNVLG